ncbi:MAG: bifunctional riboflavin kinase/FAD synthetase [Candidatus Methylacidiphilales bacterium]
MLPLFRSLEEVREAPFATLAIGFFDGLHRGHQAVILGEALSEEAAQTLVFTFDPHPARILRPDHAPPLLTGFPHKAKILEEWGVGGILAFPFTQERSQQEATSFLKEVFLALPWVQNVRVGVRWRFGHQRSGDTTLLAAVCRDQGVACRVVPDVMAGGLPVSSSRIREAVHRGDLADARDQLGRPYRLFGTVIEGQKLGRKLGFPTANLQTEDECYPPSGVYAGWVITTDGTSHPSVMNLGTRPTVEENAGTMAEAHLLVGNYDLYGAKVFFEPIQFLRPTRRFAGLEELSAAIRKDIQQAHGVLGLS